MLQEAYNKLKAKHEKLDYMEKNFGRPDWDSKEAEVGEEHATVIRERFEIINKENEPTFDPEVIDKRINEHMRPHKERQKDEFIEKFPLVKQITDSILNQAPLLKVDEYGLTPDLSDFVTIDTYFPEVRDLALLELENDDYSFGIKKEIKKLPISSIEDFASFFQNKFYQRISELEEEDLVKLRPPEVGAQETENQKKLARLFIEVQEAVDKQKKLKWKFNL